MILQKRDEISYKVKAQFATEDKMRDVLKLKECLSSMHPSFALPDRKVFLNQV